MLFVCAHPGNRMCQTKRYPEKSTPEIATETPGSLYLSVTAALTAAFKVRNVLRLARRAPVNREAWDTTRT